MSCLKDFGTWNCTLFSEKDIFNRDFQLQRFYEYQKVDEAQTIKASGCINIHPKVF